MFEYLAALDLGIGEPEDIAMKEVSVSISPFCCNGSRRHGRKRLLVQAGGQWGGVTGCRR